ncbi:hypothetical protein JAAARDRAFT_167672 [Jaapia argillacea MUCL 33604]|uniref:Translational machinery component n=1 Tax=Jaapia argillacea MUCL 33604 TaxID=933084 RepID=A0A067QCX4_9AGAM|nr:hypothetical protein JAAARDRAFT_167672 [Jaapia argillacea MUCL 33604]
MSLLFKVCRPSFAAATRRPRLAASLSFGPINGSGASYEDDLILQGADAPTVDDTEPPTARTNFYPRGTINTSRFEAETATTSLYRLHVQATLNNTITTLERPNGTPAAIFTAGKCGFKRGNRAGFEAGYQTAVATFKRIEAIKEELIKGDEGPMALELIFSGFGQGREATYRALMTSEGDVVRPLVVQITDKTPIKIGGTRAKKMRRT